MRLNRSWLRPVAMASVVAAVVLGGAGAASATAGRHDHCISPEGEDFNETFGTSARIVTSFFDCNQVYAGQRWTVPLPAWGMAKTFETVPAGFVPVADTPLDDFLAKFTGAKYVIDPGTAHQRTIFRPAGRSTWTDDSGDIDGVTAVDELKPLRVGHHVVEVYWVINGTHCDGFTDKIEECLTGTSLHVIEEFEVIRRRDG